MKLIDADKLINKIVFHTNLSYEEKELLDDMINEQPMIEQKTAHWITVGGFATPGGDPVWACSNCGKGMHVYGIEHGTYGADIADHQWVACPNCGAVMVEK